MPTRLLQEIRQTRPFTSLEQEAHLSILRTAAALDHALAEALKPHGVTPTQYNVLRILRGAGDKGLCRNDVSERMVARVPDATRLLDRMEAAGMIRRERGTEDRRFVTTHITDQGLRLLEELEGPVQELHRKHLGHLGEEDLAALVALMDRVREAL